ncbi:MAG: hypothetical protein LC720_03690, partial [Actinobacteria bacterium]|nr:hypothetical protein [Actinomycetota bacterium]
MADAPSTLALGLALAIGSATAINLGFLLQHRGLARVTATGGTRGLLRGSFVQPAWLAGQALGIAGFAAQVAAVTLAPLALVQSFAAGGLALSLPLAILLFGQRVRRSEILTVLVVAAALGSLPLGLPPSREVLGTARLAVILAGVLV